MITDNMKKEAFNRGFYKAASIWDRAARWFSAGKDGVREMRGSGIPTRTSTGAEMFHPAGTGAPPILNNAAQAAGVKGGLSKGHIAALLAGGGAVAAPEIASTLSNVYDAAENSMNSRLMNVGATIEEQGRKMFAPKNGNAALIQQLSDQIRQLQEQANKPVPSSPAPQPKTDWTPWAIGGGVGLGGLGLGAMAARRKDEEQRQ